MKRTILVGVFIMLAVPLTTVTIFAQTGNGAPNGAHFNLNLLGKTNCPGDDLRDSNRHTIMVLLRFSDPDADPILGNDPGNFASLDKRNKIFLGPGSDFQVIDGNACDRDGASFTLPEDIASNWMIYIRELGQPGGTGDITTCGIGAGADGILDTADDEVVCSSSSVELERSKGKGPSKFRNVTTELTTVSYQVPILDGDGNVIGYADDTASLFEDDFYQYFWDYDNNGLRLIQLRFYPAGQ